MKQEKLSIRLYLLTPMTSISAFLDIPPYSLGKTSKEELLTTYLLGLTKNHYETCPEYRKMLDGICFDINSVKTYYDLPFLPVRLFKEMELKSVPNDQIVKTMTSSGTTGQSVSKIYLDKITSSNQQIALVKIVTSFIGTQRLPMIIIDSSAILKDRNMFSARGAGILGFTLFSSKRIYALDEKMQLDKFAILEFLKQNKGKKVLLFGFTFMIWQYFYKELIANGFYLDLSNGVLIHGGGWKKLISEAISKTDFKKDLRDVTGLSEIHDYYGMVEQTGSIFMECEYGYLHAPAFSDVIMRNHIDFSPCRIGERGIIEVVSVLPESYPGHILLTEDEGTLLGEDDCPCGRLGKYFTVDGRIKNAEIRGCSDTHETRSR